MLMSQEDADIASHKNNTLEDKLHEYDTTFFQDGAGWKLEESIAQEE